MGAHETMGVQNQELDLTGRLANLPVQRLTMDDMAAEGARNQEGAAVTWRREASPWRSMHTLCSGMIRWTEDVEPSGAQ